jgi:hypothetical protein
MNETEFGRKVRDYLNLGTRHLSRDIATALETGRQRALEELAAEHAHAPAWAGAGIIHGAVGRSALSRWLPLALLLLLLGGAVYWQQTLMQSEDDVDAALLADDLPPNAYLDHQFHSWLERLSER